MSVYSISQACSKAFELRIEAEDVLKALGSELASGSATLGDTDREALSEALAAYESAFVGSCSSVPSSDKIKGSKQLSAEELGASLLSLAAEWEAERNF